MGKHWTDRGYNAIQYIGASNCWVDDVRYQYRRGMPLAWVASVAWLLGGWRCAGAGTALPAAHVLDGAVQGPAAPCLPHTCLMGLLCAMECASRQQHCVAFPSHPAALTSQPLLACVQLLWSSCGRTMVPSAGDHQEL